MDNILPMFQVPIYLYKMKNWDLKKKKLMEIYSSLNLEEPEDERIRTDFHQDNRPEYWDNIKKVLKEELDLFSAEAGQSLEQFGYWFETAKRGMYHDVHNHGPIGYSSVCYVQFHPSVHTSTVFVSPFYQFWNGEPMTYSPTVTEGTIVFFPSIIHHYTRPNESDYDRIILSFNLIPEEVYGQIRG